MQYEAIYSKKKMRQDEVRYCKMRQDIARSKMRKK